MSGAGGQCPGSGSAVTLGAGARPAVPRQPVAGPAPGPRNTEKLSPDTGDTGQLRRQRRECGAPDPDPTASTLLEPESDSSLV